MNQPPAWTGRVLGRRPTLTLLLVVGAWTAVGLFTGLQLYVNATLDGADASLAAAVVEQTLSALAWLPATLIAIALTHRFPLRSGAWQRSLVVHAGAALVMAFATNGLMHVFHGLTASGDRADADLLSAAVEGALRWGHVDVLVYVLIAGIAQTVRRRSEERERALHTARLEAELTRAKLRALELQLHPHFLFNTLHTIGALWRTDRPAAAQQTLERLSALLRRVLDPDIGQEVRLEEELDVVREYVAIEAVRVGDRLSVSIDVDDGVLDACLPPFILQPLVENAVRHGVERDPAAGRIAIRAHRVDDELRIDVCDDGEGLAPADAGTSATGRSVGGVGLQNTRRRLRTLYGGDDRLVLRTRPSGGVHASLRVPFRIDDASLVPAGDG